MTNITSAELSLLRQRPHSTKLWLSIYAPRTVMACQVNDGDIEHEEREIIYNNVTDGLWSHINSGMTMAVGSTAGGSDKGRIRVRSATSTVITVAENSHIDWADDLYLTVVNFYEVWSIFPFYTLDGDNVIWYKDYDIEYSTQNSDLGSIVNVGPHRALFVDENSYFSATGTVDVKDRALTYSWFFEGGTPTGSAAETPGNILYDTPGHYTASLITTVTGTSITDTTYRHVSVYDRPGEGDNTPTLQWDMDSLSGGRDEGGHSVKIKVYQDMSSIVDGALVVLFADDIYGSTAQSIGGNSQHNEKIVFTGYILDDTIEYDYVQSTVEFEVGSVVDVMKSEEGSIVSLDSNASPSDWYEIEDLSVERFFYHYLRWHSTVLLTTDFQYLNVDSAFQYQDTAPDSLYGVINTFIESSLLGKVVADRQGKLWAEIEPSAVDGVTGSMPYSGMTILRQDWVGEPGIEERTVEPLSYIEMGGVAWSSIVTGTWSAFLSGAPGTVHGYQGVVEDHQGLILTNQSVLNTLTGNVFAYKNAKYPNMSFQMSGNYRNFDIAPLELQKLTVFQEDTQRDIEFIDKVFYITGMSWNYAPDSEILNPAITMHEITQGFDGVTVDIPPPIDSNWPEIPLLSGLPPFPHIPGPILPTLPPWIIPPPIWPWDDLCCLDLYAPDNLTNLYSRGVIRSDDLIVNGTAPEIYGWRGYAIVRTPDHVNKTYLLIEGALEESDDYGVTWTEKTDTDGWDIHAVSGLQSPIVTASKLVTAIGLVGVLSVAGCANVGPGGGFMLELTPCGGGSAYTLDDEDLYTFGNDATVTAEFTLDGIGMYSTFSSDVGTVTDGEVVFLYHLTGAPELILGRLHANLLGKTLSETNMYQTRVFFHMTEGGFGQTPNIGGDAPSGAVTPPDAGETVEIIGVELSAAGGDYYFGIRLKLAAQNLTFGVGEYEWYLQELWWHETVSGTDIELFAFCKDVVRITVNDMTIYNICNY